MLTENKAANTEESMHRIQFPSYNFLQIGCDFANQKVEGPVRRSGERDTFRTDSERKNLGCVRLLELERVQTLTYLWGIQPWNRAPAGHNRHFHFKSLTTEHYWRTYNQRKRCIR